MAGQRREAGSVEVHYDTGAVFRELPGLVYPLCEKYLQLRMDDATVGSQ